MNFLVAELKIIRTIQKYEVVTVRNPKMLTLQNESSMFYFAVFCFVMFCVEHGKIDRRKIQHTWHYDSGCFVKFFLCLVLWCIYEATFVDIFLIQNWKQVEKSGRKQLTKFQKIPQFSRHQKNIPTWNIGSPLFHFALCLFCYLPKRTGNMDRSSLNRADLMCSCIFCIVPSSNLQVLW